MLAGTGMSGQRAADGQGLVSKQTASDMGHPELISPLVCKEGDVTHEGLLVRQFVSE